MMNDTTRTTPATSRASSVASSNISFWSFYSFGGVNGRFARSNSALEYRVLLHCGRFLAASLFVLVIFLFVFVDAIALLFQALASERNKHKALNIFQSFEYRLFCACFVTLITFLFGISWYRMQTSQILRDRNAALVCISAFCGYVLHIWLLIVPFHSCDSVRWAIGLLYPGLILPYLLRAILLRLRLRAWRSIAAARVTTFNPEDVNRIDYQEVSKPDLYGAHTADLNASMYYDGDDINNSMYSVDDESNYNTGDANYNARNIGGGIGDPGLDTSYTLLTNEDTEADSKASRNNKGKNTADNNFDRSVYQRHHASDANADADDVALFMQDGVGMFVINYHTGDSDGALAPTPTGRSPTSSIASPTNGNGTFEAARYEASGDHYAGPDINTPIPYIPQYGVTPPPLYSSESNSSSSSTAGTTSAALAAHQQLQTQPIHAANNNGINIDNNNQQTSYLSPPSRFMNHLALNLTPHSKSVSPLRGSRFNRNQTNIVSLKTQLLMNDAKSGNKADGGGAWIHDAVSYAIPPNKNKNKDTDDGAKALSVSPIAYMQQKLLATDGFTLSSESNAPDIPGKQTIMKVASPKQPLFPVLQRTGQKTPPVHQKHAEEKPPSPIVMYIWFILALMPFVIYGLIQQLTHHEWTPTLAQCHRSENAQNTKSVFFSTEDKLSSSSVGGNVWMYIIMFHSVEFLCLAFALYLLWKSKRQMSTDKSISLLDIHIPQKMRARFLRSINVLQYELKVALVCQCVIATILSLGSRHTLKASSNIDPLADDESAAVDELIIKYLFALLCSLLFIVSVVWPILKVIRHRRRLASGRSSQVTDILNDSRHGTIFNKHNNMLTLHTTLSHVESYDRFYQFMEEVLVPVPSFLVRPQSYASVGQMQQAYEHIQVELHTQLRILAAMTPSIGGVAPVFGTGDGTCRSSVAQSVDGCMPSQPLDLLIFWVECEVYRELSADSSDDEEGIKMAFAMRDTLLNSHEMYMKALRIVAAVVKRDNVEMMNNNKQRSGNYMSNSATINQHQARMRVASGPTTGQAPSYDIPVTVLQCVPRAVWRHILMCFNEFAVACQVDMNGGSEDATRPPAVSIAAPTMVNDDIDSDNKSSPSSVIKPRITARRQSSERDLNSNSTPSSAIRPNVQPLSLPRKLPQLTVQLRRILHTKLFDLAQWYVFQALQAYYYPLFQNSQRYTELALLMQKRHEQRKRQSKSNN